jgi:hypothetical protein
MELKVLSTGIVEPISVTDVKDFMGYTPTDQDTAIQNMITVAREWLENRCALSLVNKQYKAYFLKEDAINGWYDLPVSPVLDTPAVSVSVCGVVTTFYSQGMNQRRIKPGEVYSTLSGTTDTYYVEVTFNAGATNLTANEIIKRIVATMFKNREDGIDAGVSVGRLPYDTMRLIESINQNVSI